jgi:hypothetical protein
MKKELLTLSFLTLTAFFGNVTFAQCTYVGDDNSANGWTYSGGFHHAIKIDFQDMTASSHLTTDGNSCTTLKTDSSNYSSGIYNAKVYDVNSLADKDAGFTWPIKYYMCAFAPNGYSYAREMMNNENDPYGVSSGNTCYANNYTITNHGTDQEPSKGFAELSVLGASSKSPTVTRMGFIEIDHLPYVDAVEWSYSSDGWMRGVKVDIKIGDGDWQEQRWEPTNCKKSSTIVYTGFSQQGYKFTEKIAQSDISIRFRPWNGDMTTVDWETDSSGETLLYGSGKGISLDYLGGKANEQIARIHDIIIYSKKAYASSSVPTASIPTDGIYDENTTTSIKNTTATAFRLSIVDKTVTTSESASIDIYAVTGQLVKSVKNVQTLSLSTLPEGIYLIKAFNTNGIQTVKANIK